MSSKLKKRVTFTLIMLFFITQAFTYTVAAAGITAEDLVGQWEARLKINKLELFGTQEKNKNQIYEEAKGAKTLYFGMKDGALMLGFGGGAIPVTLSGGKLSGTDILDYGFYTVEVTVDGTVSKSAKGIEFTIHTKQEMWDTKRKNGSIGSFTYTSAGSAVAPAPVAVEEEAPVDVIEPDQESVTTETVKVTGIKVTRKTLEIAVGQSVTINAEVVPANATEKRYSWSVDHGDVIDIKTNGMITGKSPGVAKVTAVSLEGQFQDTCRVTVKEAENDIVSQESQKPESTTPMESETVDTSGDTSGKDPLVGIIIEDSMESNREIGETLNDKIKDLKVNELFDNLKSYEDELVEKRLEKNLEPVDVSRKQAGMEIFENTIKPEENEVQEKNKRAEKTTERLEKIAEKQGNQLEKVEDADGLIKLEIKVEGQKTVLNELVYNLKTEQADKLIDKVLDKTIGALVKQLKKKKLMPDLLETGMGLFGRFFKDKKDELILTDDEQIQKVREEIGVSDDVSAELYLRNNQWSEKETAAGTWSDLITKNKAAEKFNKALEEIVSLRKKDHANASKLEYELINREVNRLRMDGLPKDEAVKVIKNRYVYEYYDHYGLETKKSDGTWQDNVLQFLGLGGENRRFGGFNKDKMDVSSSEVYKDTDTRFDMIIEVMDNREDIYSDDDVQFIRKLRQEEGRE